MRGGYLTRAISVAQTWAMATYPCLVGGTLGSAGVSKSEVATSSLRSPTLNTGINFESGFISPGLLGPQKWGMATQPLLHNPWAKKWAMVA